MPTENPSFKDTQIVMISQKFLITTGLLNHAKNIVYILLVHAGCKQGSSINRSAKKRRRIQCESNDLSDSSLGLASSEQSSNHEG